MPRVPPGNAASRGGLLRAWVPWRRDPRCGMSVPAAAPEPPAPAGAKQDSSYVEQTARGSKQQRQRARTEMGRQRRGRRPWGKRRDGRQRTGHQQTAQERGHAWSHLGPFASEKLRPRFARATANLQPPSMKFTTQHGPHPASNRGHNKVPRRQGRSPRAGRRSAIRRAWVREALVVPALAALSA